VHPGFSVFAGPVVDSVAVTSLESQGRYITRPAMDALQRLDDGIVSPLITAVDNPTIPRFVSSVR
jgi:hypothetical protein